MTTSAPQPIYKAGLTTGWSLPRDRTAGTRVPQVREDYGTVHAVRPVTNELQIREPYFIEDTYNYRAALCGAKVKVIMPNTFKTEEDDACAACIAETLNPSRKPLMRPGGRGPAYLFGDRWSPGRWNRLRRQRDK